MKTTRVVSKGDRVRARWFEADHDVPLAGQQLKATEREVVGRVIRIRGDRPVDPTEAILFVRRDDTEDDVLIRPEWIVEVLPKDGGS